MTRFLAALALACALSSHAWADPTCDDQFLGGQRPALAAPASADVELCSADFATLWRPATRDPVYSAEHLTPENLTKADRTARLDAFHADARLPHGIRAEMSDYAGSAFDRGHLAPAHDMPTPASMRESFVLSNMAPQAPEANRGEWAKVEEFTRRLVILGKGAFVVTALQFDARPKLLSERVAIPAAYLKAVYVEPNPFAPAGQVGAYALANTAGARPEVITLDEMQRRTGLDPFPSLSLADHARADLPPVAAK